MATPIQLIQVRTLTTSPTTISNANSISILNGGSDDLSISTDGGTNSISLSAGQSLSMSSSTGFVLPDIIFTGTAMSAEVIIS
jgi:hypothetical protein